MRQNTTISLWPHPSSQISKFQIVRFRANRLIWHHRSKIITMEEKELRLKLMLHVLQRWVLLLRLLRLNVPIRIWKVATFTQPLITRLQREFHKLLKTLMWSGLWIRVWVLPICGPKALEDSGEWISRKNKTETKPNNPFSSISHCYKIDRYFQNL